MILHGIVLFKIYFAYIYIYLFFVCCTNTNDAVWNCYYAFCIKDIK